MTRLERVGGQVLVLLCRIQKVLQIIRVSLKRKINIKLTSPVNVQVAALAVRRLQYNDDEWEEVSIQRQFKCESIR